MSNISPLDLFDKRRLDWMPVHFKKVKISHLASSEKINEWIRYRLEGRYCLINNPDIDREEKTKIATFVGFEDEKEITYFMLACPYLRSF
jgi:hypothetical protein